MTGAHPEARLGPYRLMGRLGEGGMSVVHLALAPDGRPVALKVLRPHVAGDADGRARFSREVAALRRVRGPHVAEVLDAAVDGDPPYLVLRYVPGRSLHELVRAAGPLSLQRLPVLGAGLADALRDIHRAGVVHRDLKPGNVLVSDGGLPTVIDFGIAQLLDDSRLTTTGLFVGTPGYFAPEVVLGHPATPASDVHAWGSTMTFAATGAPPYGSGPFETVLWNITHGTAMLDGVPPALLPLVSAALQRQPRDRPTPRELLDACSRLALDAGARPFEALEPADGAQTRILPLSSPAATRVRPEQVSAPPVVPEARHPGVVPSLPLARAGAPTLRAPSPVTRDPHAEPEVPAPPARDGCPQRRRATLLAVLLLLGSLSVLAPVAGTAAAGTMLVLLRAADSATVATLRRRRAHARSARTKPASFDGARLVLSLPWHLGVGLLATAWHLPLRLVAGLAAAVPAYAVASHYPPLDPDASAVGALVSVVLLTSWCGAGSTPLRRASSWVLLRTVSSPGLSALVATATVGLAVLLLAAAGSAQSIWWPGTGAPELAGLSALAARVVEATTAIAG